MRSIISCWKKLWTGCRHSNRRMTLVRTGTLVERVQNYLNKYNTAAGQPVTGLSNVTTRKGLLPIPQTAIDLNKGAVLSQNPGY